MYHIEYHFEIVRVDGQVICDGTLRQKSRTQCPDGQTERLVIHHRLQYTITTYTCTKNIKQNHWVVNVIKTW